MTDKKFQPARAPRASQQGQKGLAIRLSGMVAQRPIWLALEPGYLHFCVNISSYFWALVVKMFYNDFGLPKPLQFSVELFFPEK